MARLQCPAVTAEAGAFEVKLASRVDDDAFTTVAGHLLHMVGFCNQQKGPRQRMPMRADPGNSPHNRTPRTQQRWML